MTSSSSTRSPKAFDRLPPGFDARTIVGLGFDRDILEEAASRRPMRSSRVSNGDNSNIVSAASRWSTTTCRT
jgi:trk system potassium uptake protein TrkA